MNDTKPISGPTPHRHDPTKEPRWRFASGNLKGCPLRQDYDRDGRLSLVACQDLKGTLDGCRECRR